MPEEQQSGQAAVAHCTLTVNIRYPGKPVLGIVTSRPDANGAVTFQRLDDDGVPMQNAHGAARLPLQS